MPLAVDGVEVSQAIQYYHSLFPLCGPPTARIPCGDNSIPLVAGKNTVVRVYVSGTPSGAPISGTASYTNAQGAQKFLAPLTATSIPAGAPSRAVAGEGLTFLIPSQDAYAGSARLDVAAFVQSIGPPQPSASATLTLTFEERDRLLIRLVRIHYQAATQNLAAPTVQDFWALIGYARRVFPVAAARIQLIGDSVEKFDGLGTGILAAGAPGTPAGGTTGTPFYILDQLAAAEALSPKVVYLAFYSLATYVAVVAPGFSGSGWARRTVICADPAAGHTVAHELGHSLYLAHAPGGGAGGPDPNYPSYPPFQSGSIGEVGFDGSNGDPKDPATHFDFMSYGSPPWISPYHYLKLHQTIGPGTSSSPLPPPGSGKVPPRDVAFLTVQRLLERNVIVRLPGWVLPAPFPPISEVGEFSAELSDATGRPLATTRFDIPQRPKSHHTDETDFLCVALPWFDEAQRLRVSRGGKVVFEHRIEKAAPPLAAHFPVGDVLGGLVAIRWSCRTPLSRVLLQYSADAGTTWAGINLPGKARSFEVNLDQLPGGERCCFQLLASRGLRTRAVRSRFFRVSTKTPRPLMITPSGRVAPRPSGPVELVGAVTGQGDPDSLRWTSSLDGELGRGPYLMVPVLSRGRHRIGLHVGDADERSQYATLVIAGEPRKRGGRR